MKYKTQIAIRKDLEEKGYAKFEEARIGRSKRLLMEITTKGYEAIGLPVPHENKGRGGITHRHFANWIKLHFEKKGYWVRVGYSLINLGLILFVFDLFFYGKQTLHLFLFWVTTGATLFGMVFCFYA